MPWQNTAQSQGSTHDKVFSLHTPQYDVTADVPDRRLNFIQIGRKDFGLQIPTVKSLDADANI